MKKILVLFLLIVGMFQPVFAKHVKVEAVSDFSTANPPAQWEVKTVSNITTKSGTVIPANSLLKGNIINIKDPKRLKRDATFSFEVTEFINSKTQITTQLKKKVIGKYSSLTEVTPGKIIKQGAITAGDKFIGAYIGPSVALVEGAVKNEQGNRAKSAAKSVYESTPISYVEKGQELEIKQGTVFVMDFKIRDDFDDEDEALEEYNSKSNDED